MSRKTQSKDIPIDVPPVHPWGDLFGFDAFLAQMQSLLSKDTFPQAALFEGREGIGKRKLIAALLGLIYCKDQAACGVCEECRAVQYGFHPDVLWIESEGTIKVADAEKLQEHLAVRAHNNAAKPAWRVVVMVDIEELTDQAANRLLKTLEEPPAQVRILMTCSRVSQLLPTIRSRLVSWHVQPPPMAQSLEWLRAKVAEEGLSYEPKQITAALERFGLSPGRALTLLRQERDMDPESLRRLETLLLKPLDGNHLPELQELVKKHGWKAHELAQRLEVLLNRYYKWSLGVSSQQVSPVDHQRVLHWRKILHEVYRAGGSGHNHLNTQLIVDAWTC